MLDQQGEAHHRRTFFNSIDEFLSCSIVERIIGRHSSISCFDAEPQADREVCTKSGSPGRVFMGFRLLPVPLRRMIREH